MYSEENVNRKLQDQMSYYLENRGKKPLNELIYQRQDLREAYSKKDPTMSTEYLQSMRDDKYKQEMLEQEALVRGIDPSLLDDMVMNKDELDLLKNQSR